MLPLIVKQFAGNESDDIDQSLGHRTDISKLFEAIYWHALAQRRWNPKRISAGFRHGLHSGAKVKMGVVGFSIYLLCQASPIVGKASDTTYRTSNMVSIGVGCHLEKTPPTWQDQKVRGAVSVVTETMPGGIRMISRYGKNGYLQEVLIFNNQGDLTSHKIYTLDQLNRLRTILDTWNGDTIEYQYSYDQHGDLAQIVRKTPNANLDVLWRRVGTSPQSTIEQLCYECEYEHPIWILTRQTTQDEVCSTIKSFQGSKILTTAIARFDSAGRLVEMKFVHPDGAVMSISKWTYLSTNAVKQIEKWMLGDSLSRENYFYHHGRLVKVEERNESGTLMSRTQLHESGQPYIKEDFENRRLISRTIHRKDGLIQRTDKFDTKQTVITSTIYKYRYDRSGNWIKEIEQTVDKRTGTSTRFVTTRDFQYYD